MPPRAVAARAMNRSDVTGAGPSRCSATPPRSTSRCRPGTAPPSTRRARASPGYPYGLFAQGLRRHVAFGGSAVKPWQA